MLWSLECMCLLELPFSFFSEYIPRSGIGRSYGSSSIYLFIFGGNVIAFSSVAVPIHIPTSSVKCSLFSTPTLVFIMTLWIFGWEPYWPVWGDTLLYILICISLIISDIGHLFMSLLVICVFLGGNVYLGLLPNFWLNYLFF